MENKIQSKRKLIIFLSGFVIWGLMTAIWGKVWYDYYADIIMVPFFRRGNWMVIILYGVILFFVTQFYGGYRVGYLRRGDIIFSAIMSMLVTNFITYFQVLAIGRMMPSVATVKPIFWMSVGEFFLIWLWATLADKLYLHLNPPRHLLVVYGGSGLTQSLIGKMAGRDDKYIIQEVINIQEGLMKVMERMEGYTSVLLCDVKSGHRNRLLKHCYERSIRVYMTPKISDILIRGASSIHLFDTPLLLSRNNGLSAEQLFMKRILDLILSSVALIVLSPIMLLVGLCIKLEDGGPVFYKQVRLTIGGRQFFLYKFRSMVVDAEKKSGARLAGKNDSRITKVGRVIRKFRIDELPQLLNIIHGTMSIVGPRPERPEIAEEYKKDMPEFDFRLKVKAGLTGQAQVHGKYNTTPYDKLKLDLMYISGYSVTLDIKLILQTIKTLFMWESTEGVEESPSDLSGEVGE